MRKRGLVFVGLLLVSFLLMTEILFAGGKKEQAAGAAPTVQSVMPAPSEAKINWQQFKGTRIAVLFSNHPWQEAVEPLLPEFEALTGINLDYTHLPEVQFQTRVNSGLAAGTFGSDVFMSQYFDAPKHTLEGWTANLEGYLNDPQLTDPNWYDWNDFFPGQRALATIGDTYFDRIPITTEVQVLIYRSDIYDQLGLTPPDTFEDLIRNCETIQAKTNMAGITIRGGAHLWWPFHGVIQSYGGAYFDERNNPVIDSAGAKAGANIYVQLSRFTPPGITTYTWDEINTAMVSGNAAQFLDSSVAYSRLQDPERSTIVGKVKVAPFPQGPAGRIAHAYSWSISMAESSKNKKAAWLFIQWITGKDVMYKLAMKGVLSPRDSVWADPAFQAQFSPDYVKSAQESLKSATSAPPTMRFWEAMDLLDKQIQKAMLGEQSPERALDNTQALWRGMK